MEEAVQLTTQFIEKPSFSTVAQFLEQAVHEGVFPGAVLNVSRHGETIFSHVAGQTAVKLPKGFEPARMSIDTVFDIAGLTGALATTSLLIKLVEVGRIKIDDRVSRYLQGFGVLGKSPITVRHLLTHTSGLPAWHPYFEELVQENSESRMGILTSRGARDYVLNSIVRSTLKGEVGEKYLYSDIGLMLIGFLIETTTGYSLDRAMQKYLLQPIGMKSSSFIDLSRVRRRGIHPVTEIIAPTEECPWRKRILWGEVHDDNAWAMGGVAGHCGLFSTAADLQILLREIIRSYNGRRSFFPLEIIKECLNGTGYEGIGIVKLGWDTPSKENGMSECGFSESTFGYNGFTGCSAWVDPKNEISIVLLSNRINPTRSNKKILAFRPELHRAVLSALRVAQA
jgi:CubicO group peptidase (beta-lactamase class C family)